MKVHHKYLHQQSVTMSHCLLLGLVAFAPNVFGMAPMQCNLSVLVTLQVSYLSHRLAIAIHSSKADHQQTLQGTEIQSAGHVSVCLVAEWTSVCLCLAALFRQLVRSGNLHPERFLPS